MTESRPPRPAASLSLRLVAGALVWLVLMLVAGGAVLAHAFRTTVEGEFTHRLDALLRAMIAATDIAPDGSVKAVRPLGDPRFDQIFSGWYWEMAEPSGRLVRSRSLWDAAITPAPGGPDAQIRTVVGPRNEPLLVVERDLEFPEARGPLHLLVAADRNEVAEEVRHFDLLLFTALGLLGGGLAVAVFIQVGFGLRPLRSMAADLAAVREGVRPRLEGRYPKEVRPLAEAMNGVLDSDAALIERARTHVGNLAHALKTPLAVLGAELNGDPDRQVLSDQIQRMRRLVEHHLARASAVAGAGRALGVKVNIRGVAEALAAVLARMFADRGLVIDLQVPDGPGFRGQRQDLEEMLGNLMENACKWARAQVRVSAEEDRAGVSVTVEDDGPGLSETQATEALRRGRRLDEVVPGWGLGLAIVCDLAEVNGGTLEFGRSDLGGLRVLLRFPGRKAGL